WRRSIVVSASTPLPACPMTSMPPTSPSRKPSSSRASCSSSTRTARSVSSMSGGDPFRDGELGNLDAGARAFTRHAGELQLTVRAVDRAQALVDVAQADPAAERMLETLLGHPEPIVVHLDDGVSAVDRRD